MPFDFNSILKEKPNLSLIKDAVRDGSFKDQNGYIWLVTATNRLAVKELQRLDYISFRLITYAVPPNKKFLIFSKGFKISNGIEVLEVTHSFTLPGAKVNFSHIGDFTREQVASQHLDIHPRSSSVSQRIRGARHIL